MNRYDVIFLVSLFGCIFCFFAFITHSSSRLVNDSSNSSSSNNSVHQVMCKMPSGEIKTYKTISEYPLSKSGWNFVTIPGEQVYSTNCHVEFKL